MTDIKYLYLWDTYKGLLTPTQQEITDLYFNCDLSLGEIAEQRNVSRQSISDTINKSKKQLDDIEYKLHLVEKQNTYSLEVSKTLTSVTKMLQGFIDKNPEHKQEIMKIIDALVVGEKIEEEY